MAPECVPETGARGKRGKIKLKVFKVKISKNKKQTKTHVEKKKNKRRKEEEEKNCEIPQTAFSTLLDCCPANIATTSGYKNGKKCFTQK